MVSQIYSFSKIQQNRFIYLALGLTRAVYTPYQYPANNGFSFTLITKLNDD
jgi:hypothetical protein